MAFIGVRKGGIEMVLSVEKVIALVFAFTLGLSGGWILWGKGLQDHGNTISQLRAELEQSNQALIRSQSRVIDSKRAVDRGRSQLDYSLGKLEIVGSGLDGIQELAQSSLGILGDVRKSNLD